MTVAENIWLGVFSGVLTSALLFLLGRLWVYWLLPLLKAMRYQGVVVQGLWHADLKNDPGEPDTTVELDLRQSTQTLSGTLTITNRKPGNEWVLTHLVHGRLWEGYISMSLTPQDRKITAVATGLFKVHGGGTLLDGVLCARDVNLDKVRTDPLKLFRKAQITH